MASVLTHACVRVKRTLVREIPSEFTYQPSVGHDQLTSILQRSALLHAAEGVVETEVVRMYCLDEVDIQAVLDETGRPAGWFPLIPGHDQIPLLDDEFQISEELVNSLADHERRTLSPEELRNFQNRLRSLYEAGPGAKVEEREGSSETSGEEDESGAVTVGACIPIPTETFLEELSQQLQIHPISIYWLLKEGIEQHGWRCIPEEQRLARDRVTVMVLRLLAIAGLIRWR